MLLTIKGEGGVACEVIYAYRRGSGEVVTFTRHPGRLVVVDIDGEVVNETFVKPEQSGTRVSIEDAATRFALDWQKADAAYTVETRPTV